MHDGDIDYSKYTLRELEEVFAGINKHQYPKNYANLCAAYERLTATLVEAPRPENVSTNDAAEHQPSINYWDRFWGSRPIAGIGGGLCLWWAYDVFTRLDSCHSGKKLMGVIVDAICENFGHAVAAGIPFVLGCISAAYAVLPRRRDGA